MAKIKKDDLYKNPEGTAKLDADLQEKMDRVMSAPMVVALMSAKPNVIPVGQTAVDFLVTGLVMGNEGFYNINTGSPNKYQVFINSAPDKSVIVKEVQYVDPITVKLTVSTEKAKPGLYDISFSNSLGETLTGLRVLRIGEV